MSDTLVLVIAALLALGVPAWTVWALWHITRHAPARQQALCYVLGGTAGTALLGAILPALLLGALDPFPIWLAYAALSVASATVLAWRWPVLPHRKGHRPALALTSCVLLVAVALAGVAVT